MLWWMIIIFKGYLLHSKNIRIYAVSLTFIYWCTFRITLWVDTLLAAIPLGIRRESLSWTFNGLRNVSFALWNLDMLCIKLYLLNTKEKAYSKFTGNYDYSLKYKVLQKHWSTSYYKFKNILLKCQINICRHDSAYL